MAIPINFSSHEHPLSLHQIFELEPKTRALWVEAVQVGMANPSYDNEDLFFRQFKPRIVQLVGFNAPASAPNPLRTTESYATLFRSILEAVHCWERFQCLQLEANAKHYKRGWAAFQFKNIFGMMPRFPVKRHSPFERSI